jgi:hypothetical protein
MSYRTTKFSCILITYKSKNKIAFILAVEWCKKKKLNEQLTELDVFTVLPNSRTHYFSHGVHCCCVVAELLLIRKSIVKMVDSFAPSTYLCFDAHP